MGLQWTIVFADIGMSAPAATAAYFRNQGFAPAFNDEKYVWAGDELRVENLNPQEIAAAGDAGLGVWNAFTQWQDQAGDGWLDCGFARIDSVGYGLITLPARNRLRLLGPLVDSRLARPVWLVHLLKQMSGAGFALFGEFTGNGLLALHRCITAKQMDGDFSGVLMVGGVMLPAGDAALSECALIEGIEVRSRLRLLEVGP